MVKKKFFGIFSILILFLYLLLLLFVVRTFETTMSKVLRVRKTKTDILMERIVLFKKDEEQNNKNGIYFETDEENIERLYGLVIGTEDTPYFGGYFMFDIRCPVKTAVNGGFFPFIPPIIKYLTTDGKIRMTPNYYEGGKVCLSLIGTWGENTWSQINNFDTILTTLQSCLQKNSLNMEPGYAKNPSTCQVVIEYEDYATYNSYNYAFCEMVENCLNGKKHPILKFKDVVLKTARENIEKVIEEYRKWMELKRTSGRLMGNYICGNALYTHAHNYKYNMIDLERRLSEIRLRLL
jgi:ubiquitin-protein ligase